MQLDVSVVNFFFLINISSRRVLLYIVWLVVILYSFLHNINYFFATANLYSYKLQSSIYTYYSLTLIPVTNLLLADITQQPSSSFPLTYYLYMLLIYLYHTCWSTIRTCCSSALIILSANLLLVLMFKHIFNVCSYVLLYWDIIHYWSTSYTPCISIISSVLYVSPCFHSLTFIRICMTAVTYTNILELT